MSAPPSAAKGRSATENATLHTDSAKKHTAGSGHATARYGRSANGSRTRSTAAPTTVSAANALRVKPAYVMSPSNVVVTARPTASAPCSAMLNAGAPARFRCFADRKKRPSSAMAKYTRGPAITIALTEDTSASAMQAASALLTLSPKRALAATSATISGFAPSASGGSAKKKATLSPR